MLSSLNPSAVQFLNGLNGVSSRMEAAQKQLTTGLKLSTVSDAPDSVSSLLSARANFSRTEQTLSNLGRVKTEVDAGEQALQGAVSLLEKAQTLGAQGATDTQNAVSRADVAGQIDGVLQQLIGLASTSVEGRYIFSGDSDQTAPYTYNPSLANPVSAYLGSASTRQTAHPNGSSFPVALTAQQIFDSADPTTNVFSSLKALSTALKADDVKTAQTVLDGLNKVGGYLNSQLGFYGNTQNRVADAVNFGQSYKTQLQTEIAGYEDADTTNAILEFTQAQTQQQAALQSRARMPHTSLFDFLG